MFHHVCTTPGCGPLSVRATTLRAFVGWLATRAPLGTRVRTVDQVIGGPVRPIVRDGPAPAHGAVNGSLTTVGAYDASSDDLLGPTPARASVPRCWTEAGYGDNAVDWTHLAAGRTGRAAEQVTMLRHVSGDAKLLPRFDLGECAPTATPGSGYRLTAWYRGTVRTQFSVYYRTPVGRWVYWTSSPFFPAKTQWTKATWRTPALPGGGSAVSFGLAIADVGTLTTDDYGIAADAPVSRQAAAVRMSLTTVLLIGGVAVVCAVYTLRVRPRTRPQIARADSSSNKR